MPIDTEELRRLLKEATPGPWNLSQDKQTITQTRHLTRDVWVIPRSDEDMELIVAAVNALPSLLAAAERGARIENASRELRKYLSEAGDDTICTCGMADTGSGECEMHVALESLDAALSAEGSDEG